MRKRLLLLLSLIFLLCGCTAEVNITISDSSIEESVAITVMADNTTSKSMIKDGFRVNMPAFEYSPLREAGRFTGIQSTAVFSATVPKR